RRRARHRRPRPRQPPAGRQDARGRLRHPGPLAPRQHRGHVLGPTAARRPPPAGGRERRQFPPAASDAVRRLRLHRPTMTIAVTFLPRTAPGPLPPIAFIGGGNMASAIIGGLIQQGVAADNFEVVEPFEEARTRLAQTYGIVARAEASEALSRCAAVVWAVKPQTFAEAARPVRAFAGDALHLSVAAGIPSDSIAR